MRLRLLRSTWNALQHAILATSQPSGFVFRAGRWFDSLPAKDAPAEHQESARGVGLDESTDALTVNRNPL